MSAEGKGMRGLRPHIVLLDEVPADVMYLVAESVEEGERPQVVRITDVRGG